MRGSLGETPSQTVGPYYAMCMGREGENIARSSDGERIIITGQVLDGDGKHIEDALLEAWQADPRGIYNHPDDRRDLNPKGGFTGFARANTDFKTGVYLIDTVKPGRVPDPEGEMQAPHISVIIQARGTLNPVYTRIYFGDEEEANAGDRVLRKVPTDRRHTLIAQADPKGDVKKYRFDVRFQGDDETVFFDV